MRRRAHPGGEVSVRREIDEAWIEAAIERYQRIESLQADFEQALAKVDVTVRSPDGLVEIVVGADGVIRDVAISESASGRSGRELSQAVLAAITAAGDAARWARTKLHSDAFGGFQPDLGLGPHQRRSDG
jgi:DNA-binding protein YbaB